MGFLDAVILGALQGLTEFLPISSSGHLVIGESLLGLEMTALKSFDVAVHLGTLVAVLAYFWGDFWEMLKAFGRICVGKVRKDDRGAVLLGYVLVGTIPAVIVGLLWGDLIDSVFRNVWMVGMSMVVIGGVFLLAEYVGRRSHRGKLSVGRVCLIGLMQACALIPGVSRSGATISGGLFAGMSRIEAARFSFLLGAPAIAGAGIFTALKDGLGEIPVLPVLVGFLVSAVVGFFAVWGLMKFLKKNSLLVFAIYLFIIGLGVIFY